MAMRNVRNTAFSIERQSHMQLLFVLYTAREWPILRHIANQINHKSGSMHPPNHGKNAFEVSCLALILRNSLPYKRA